MPSEFAALEQMRHFFYVLLCADGSYYAGYTTDPARRESEHNRGIGSKYTKSRRPVRMIYQESFSTRSEAMQAEAAFKKLTRRQKEKKLKESLAEWPSAELAERKERIEDEYTKKL